MQQSDHSDEQLRHLLDFKISSQLSQLCEEGHLEKTSLSRLLYRRILILLRCILSWLNRNLVQQYSAQYITETRMTFAKSCHHKRDYKNMAPKKKVSQNSCLHLYFKSSFRTVSARKNIKKKKPLSRLLCRKILRLIRCIWG